jgi:hypothetical protein
MDEYCAKWVPSHLVPSRIGFRDGVRSTRSHALYTARLTMKTTGSGYPHSLPIHSQAGLEPTSLVRVDIQFHRKAQSAQSNSRATRLSWAAAHRGKALLNGYILASIADGLALFLVAELSRRVNPSVSCRRAAKMRPGSALSTFSRSGVIRSIPSCIADRRRAAIHGRWRAWCRPPADETPG